ncbi:MAG: methyltransferase domain-containing protein [Oligoflexales bacterium]
MLGRNKADAWNPKQYHLYKNSRNQPALDLMNTLPKDDVLKIVDLGCGPGNVTQQLKARYPNSHVLGIDNSSPMLAQAKENYPQIDWQKLEISDVKGSFDLIFSNAALHWLSNHKQLFPNLLELLSPKGTLAIQMPCTKDRRSHICLESLVNDYLERFPELKQHMRKNPVCTMEEYYELLAETGVDVDIWETTYLHVLEGDNPVLEWMKGSALSPIRGTLKGDDYHSFEKEYGEKLKDYYPINKNFKTFYQVKRIFILAKK